MTRTRTRPQTTPSKKSVSFTITIATKGRASILATFTSLVSQLKPGDEILVVRNDHPWGHRARNEAMPRSAGTHLLWVDDDDRHMKGSLDLIREKVARAPERVHLFAMASANGIVVKPGLRVGAVGTPMICVPNTPGLLGVWSDEYQGDFDFLASTMELRGDRPVLHGDVVALIAAK